MALLRTLCWALTFIISFIIKRYFNNHRNFVTSPRVITAALVDFASDDTTSSNGRARHITTQLSYLVICFLGRSNNSWTE